MNLALRKKLQLQLEHLVLLQHLLPDYPLLALHLLPSLKKQLNCIRYNFP